MSREILLDKQAWETEACLSLMAVMVLVAGFAIRETVYPSSAIHQSSSHTQQVLLLEVEIHGDLRIDQACPACRLDIWN